ncbi:MAG: TonB-dependent receptor [Elusimicrobiota bacterium]|jgi:iron complex outermembrane receptor protein
MKHLAVLFFSAVFFPASAFAGTGDDDSLEFFAEEAKVLTSASKHPQTAAEAPGSAYIITDQDIERYGYRSVAEALQSVPGFFVTTDRNYTFLWVRGVYRPGDYNTHILYMINGHRLNESLYASTNLEIDCPVDIGAVSRIEVVKGPGSSVHGDNAFFGVVNIVTKTIKDERGAVGAQAGSQRTYQGHARAAGRFSKDAEFFFAGSAYRSQGEDLQFPQVTAHDDGWFRDSDREQTGSVFASAKVSNLFLQASYSSREKRIPTGSFSSFNGQPASFTRDNRGFLDAQGQWGSLETLQASARAYYDDYAYDADFLTISPAPPPDTYLNRDLGRLRWFGEEVRLSKNLFGENLFMFGQEYEQSVYGLLKNFDADPLVVNTDVGVRPHRWALFIQQDLRAHEKLTLSGGVRMDRYKSFGNTYNTRGSAVLRPFENSVWKFLYGTAFRAPVPAETDFSQPGIFDPNAGLRPEKMQTLETRWEQSLGRGQNLSLGFFRNRIKQLISQVTDPVTGVGRYENQENLLSQGMELDFRLRPWHGVSARAAYVFQKTRFDGGEELGNSPRHVADFGVDVSGLDGRANASVDSLVIGSRRSMQGTTLASTPVYNAHLRAKPWHEGLILTLSVYNLTDADVLGSGASEHVQDALPQGSRRVIGGIEYRW